MIFCVAWAPASASPAKGPMAVTIIAPRGTLWSATRGTSTVPLEQGRDQNDTPRSDRRGLAGVAPWERQRSERDHQARPRQWHPLGSATESTTSRIRPHDRSGDAYGQRPQVLTARPHRRLCSCSRPPSSGRRSAIRRWRRPSGFVCLHPQQWGGQDPYLGSGDTRTLRRHRTAKGGDEAAPFRAKGSKFYERPLKHGADASRGSRR